jgi:hypothetical protein
MALADPVDVQIEMVVGLFPFMALIPDALLLQVKIYYTPMPPTPARLSHTRTVLWPTTTPCNAPTRNVRR